MGGARGRIDELGPFFASSYQIMHEVGGAISVNIQRYLESSGNGVHLLYVFSSPNGCTLWCLLRIWMAQLFVLGLILSYVGIIGSL